MNLNEKYQLVANVLAGNIPEEWTSAWVDSEIKDDTAESTYDYIASTGETKWFRLSSIDDSLIVTRALRDVRDFMAEQTGDKWKKVRFTLHADGTFNTKFEYDD